MDNMRFDAGRHSGKTFREVVERNPKWCQDVKNNVVTEHPKYCPREFREYLLSRSNSEVKEKSPHFFIKALSEDQRKELNEIIGKICYESKNVHYECENGLTNGFLGVYYKYFIKKCICNKKDVDAMCKLVEIHASIFPIKVSATANVKITNLDVMRSFDDEMVVEMQQFIDEHFHAGTVTFLELGYLMLSNIYEFRKKYFSTEAEMKRLESAVRGRRLIDDSGDKKFQAFRRCNSVSSNLYLKTFPRLNDLGVQRYLEHFRFFRSVHSALSDDAVPAEFGSNQYWLTLPEQNIHQLLSLLDVELLKSERNIYIQRLQKYIFFFIRAVNCPENPVFFIDDILFLCLKSFHQFKVSRKNPLELTYPLSMMTLIYRRKQPTERYNFNFDLDNANLMAVKEYIESIPGIEDAEIDYEIKTDFLETVAFMYIPRSRVCLDVCFSRQNDRCTRKKLEMIIIAVLCDLTLPIEGIISYNAYKGEECKITFPGNSHEIISFIQKYNRWDFSKELPIAKNFTWGFENCFVSGTLAWENGSQ